MLRVFYVKKLIGLDETKMAENFSLWSVKRTDMTWVVEKIYPLVGSGDKSEERQENVVEIEYRLFEVIGWKYVCK